MRDNSDASLTSTKGKTFQMGSLTSSEILAVVAEGIGEENIRQLVSYTALVQDRVPKGKICREVRFFANPNSDRLLNEICEEVIKKYNLKDARLFHVIGSMKIDDDQILAIAVGEDRKQTFKAIQEMVVGAKAQAGIRGVYILSDGTELEIPP
ncbi:MAG: molybdenum cofactor biosynthesis protein MoaE [Candidatus Hodarchaeota archaeon]